MGSKSALVWFTAIFCALLGHQARADWLAAQAQANGSYSTPVDLATPTQATAEAVRTLRVLGRGAEVHLVVTVLHRSTDGAAAIAELAEKIRSGAHAVSLKSGRGADLSGGIRH